MRHLNIKVIGKIKTYYFAFKVFSADYLRYMKFSRQFDISTQSKMLGVISVKSHVIEKGLTMPNMRPGFGKENILELIALCRQYKERNYDVENPQYKCAIRNIKEYDCIHKEQGYPLDLEIVAAIDGIAQMFPTTNASLQPTANKKSFIHNSHTGFAEFAKSRHSIRNYSNEPIIESALEASLSLAETTPTACNRQSNRVYLIENKPLILQILELQNGNRGFGNLADKLIVLAVDLSMYGSCRERNLPYIDSGLYAMNLLYSLHYYQIGTCPLNWCSSKKDDIKLRGLLHIKDSEVVTLLILCGNIPETDFKYALSERMSFGNYLTKL